MSSVHSGSTSKAAQKAREQKLKEEKTKKDKEKEPKYELTTTHLVNVPDKNKITHCAFHSVLPWLVLTPKHGHECIVWDYAAGKIISTLHLLDLLSSQRPHSNASTSSSATASWNEELAGPIVHISFVDESCLMWERFTQQNHVRPTSAFSESNVNAVASDSGQGRQPRRAAASETPLFAAVGPHHDPNEELYFKDIAVRPSDDKNTDDDDDADNQAGGAETRDTCLLVIARNVAVLVSVGTATIHRTLLTSSVGNRAIVSCVVLPIVGAHNPVAIMGCNDGCLMLWDPVRAITTQEVSKPHLGFSLSQGALLKQDCVSIHQSPHASGIVSMAKFMFLLPHPAAPEQQATFDIEGASTFRGSHLVIVIGTEGGSVTMMRLHNRDDDDVIWSTKKVHDYVYSLCVAPQSPADRHTEADHVYRPDTQPVERNEFITTLGMANFIYSLGPHHIIQQDPRNGGEVRKIKVTGMNMRHLIPGAFRLFMVCESSNQFSIGYDLNQASDQENWLGIDPLIERGIRLAHSASAQPAGLPAGGTATAQTKPGHSKSSSVVAIQQEHAVASLEDFIDKQQEHFKLYRMVHHPMLPNTTVALCTNAGLILTDITVRRAGDISFIQQQPKLPKHGSSLAGVGDDGASAAPSAMSAYTSASAMTTRSSDDGIPTSDKYEFLYCHGPTGKAATATLNIPFDALYNAPATVMLLPLLGETTTSSSVAAASSARRNEHVVNRLIVCEPNPTYKVVKLCPSPNGCLVAALTDTRDIQLYDASHGFTVLTMPSMTRADMLVWSASSKAFAVMSLESKKITVATVKKVAGAKGHTTYAISPSTHDVMPANVPVGISGGRWLCIHYQASFSGLSSQFYRWESSMAGGGAVGGFIPQPLFLQWDRLATLCALAYPTCVVFMEARRKVFSKVNAVDVSSPPQDILFCNKALFVMFEREIMLLLPTRNIVQKVIVASINPALVTHPLHAGSSAVNAEEASFAYRAALRPSGKLSLKGVVKRLHPEDVEKHVLALIVSDEVLQCFAVPLSQSLTQLLLYIHSYTSITSNPADRLFVQRRLLRTVTNVNRHGAGAASGGTSAGNSMFTVAVHQFCQDAGCDVLQKAAEAGIVLSQTTDGAEGEDAEVLIASEAVTIDLRCIEDEVRWLTAHKLASEAPAESTGTAPVSTSSKMSTTVISNVVRKLMKHAADSHSGGWTSEESIIRGCFDAISSAAERLRPNRSNDQKEEASPKAAQTQSKSDDFNDGNSDLASDDPGELVMERNRHLKARREVLMDIAFELFTHLPL